MTGETPFNFEDFHREHESLLYEFVYSRLAHNLHVEDVREIAEDVTVEAFLSMYRRVHLLKPGDETRARDALYKFAAWLCDGP